MSVFLAVTCFFFLRDEEKVEQHFDENGDDWKNGGETSDRTRFHAILSCHCQNEVSSLFFSFVSLKSLLPKFLNR